MEVGAAWWKESGMRLDAISGPLGGYVMLTFQAEGYDDDGPEELELVMSEVELERAVAAITSALRY